MPNTEEQRRDVIENCDYLLNNILTPFEQTDDTPEGRMITQLKWFKEQAENFDLKLPVEPTKTSTLRYVYTNGELLRHASSFDKSHNEIEIYLDRLMYLTTEGRLLSKTEYYDYMVQWVDHLSEILKMANRRLTDHEALLLDELSTLNNYLSNHDLLLPLSGYTEFPNFRKVYRISKTSIDDLPGGNVACSIVANFIFNGIRPDEWLTLEDADRETRKMMS